MIVLFPTLIEYKTLDFNNAEFIERSKQLKASVVPENDWQCDTFSTLNTAYNVLEDSLFSELISKSTKVAFDFASNYGDMSNKTITCNAAWVNVSSPGNYQEYHNHTRNHFSAVYYVKVPPNSGNIVFRSYDHSGDMFALPFTNNEEKDPAFRTYFVVPKESDLIVFRSNLEHMVQKNKSTEDRISIAMNFIID